MPDIDNRSIIGGIIGVFLTAKLIKSAEESCTASFAHFAFIEGCCAPARNVGIANSRPIVLSD